jgi:hypothetical protein
VAEKALIGEPFGDTVRSTADTEEGGVGLPAPLPALTYPCPDDAMVITLRAADPRGAQ